MRCSHAFLVREPDAGCGEGSQRLGTHCARVVGALRFFLRAQSCRGNARCRTRCMRSEGFGGCRLFCLVESVLPTLESGRLILAHRHWMPHWTGGIGSQDRRVAGLGRTTGASDCDASGRFTPWLPPLAWLAPPMMPNTHNTPLTTRVRPNADKRGVTRHHDTVVHVDAQREQSVLPKAGLRDKGCGSIGVEQHPGAYICTRTRCFHVVRGKPR